MYRLLALLPSPSPSNGHVIPIFSDGNNKPATLACLFAGVGLLAVFLFSKKK